MGLEINGGWDNHHCRLSHVYPGPVPGFACACHRHVSQRHTPVPARPADFTPTLMSFVTWWQTNQALEDVSARQRQRPRAEGARG